MTTTAIISIIALGVVIAVVAGLILRREKDKERQQDESKDIEPIVFDDTDEQALDTEADDLDVKRLDAGRDINDIALSNDELSARLRDLGVEISRDERDR